MYYGLCNMFLYLLFTATTYIMYSKKTYEETNILSLSYRQINYVKACFLGCFLPIVLYFFLYHNSF